MEATFSYYKANDDCNMRSLNSKKHKGELEHNYDLRNKIASGNGNG